MLGRNGTINSNIINKHCLTWSSKCVPCMDRPSWSHTTDSDAAGTNVGACAFVASTRQVAECKVVVTGAETGAHKWVQEA